MKKLCMLAMLALALAVLPAAAGAQSVMYLDQDGKEQWSPENTILIDSDFINGQSNTIYLQHNNWYAVSGSVTTGGKYFVTLGAVHLILCDGATLTVNQGVVVEWINENPGRLTIYAQSTGDDMGSLDTGNPNFTRAGIRVSPGQTLTINGGHITATGGNQAAGIGGHSGVACGTVTINGGMVTAVSSAGGGAGIGGGCAPLVGPSGNYYPGPSCAGGSVTITGGTVMAQGSKGAPAIGAGLGTGTPNHGSLQLLPKANCVYIATDPADDSLIGVFEGSQENRISSLSGKGAARITAHESAPLVAVSQSIAALPDPGSYTPGDSAVDQQILDAWSALEALSATDEGYVSSAHKEKLAALLSKLGEYILLDGDGQSVTAGSTVPLSFRASGPIAWFTGILVDGEAVARDCYTSKAGSTVVTLNPGYVATLAVGTHTLTFQYDGGGTVNASFHVLPAPAAVANLPQTGDRSSLLLWAVLALLCVGGAAVLWARSKKK